MKKSHRIITILVLILAVFITACGNNLNTAVAPVDPVESTATALSLPTITNTPDPCAPENLEAEVLKIHTYMREFDDSASLAGSIMQGIANGQMQMNDLSDAVPNMQRIRREAEDQPTPACLVNLKTYQINHMYAVLNSLTAFLSGDQQGFDQNVGSARQFHDQYVVELARLLGQTVVPIAPPSSETPSP